MTEKQYELLVAALAEQSELLKMIAEQLQKLKNPLPGVDLGKADNTPVYRCSICRERMQKIGAMLVCRYCEDEKAKPAHG